MKWRGHLISAVPFLAAGFPVAALGCLLPDAVWLINEYRFRKSRIPSWATWITLQSEASLIAYRCCHSVMAPGLLSVAGFHELAAGWTLHLLLDLPTHRGRMSQRPFYPFSNWQWPERFTLWSNI